MTYNHLTPTELVRIEAYLNPSHLIVEKNSRIGKRLVIPTIFQFILRIQEHLLNED